MTYKYLSAHRFKSAISEDPSIADSHIITKTFDITTLEDNEDTIKALGDDERILRMILSTGSVDRAGDTIDPSGWNLKEFKKSGVVLWSHDSYLPPIAKPIETWKAIKEGRLYGTASFTPPDMPHPLGDGFGYTIYRMYREGYMKAVSVGFISSEWSWSDDKKRDGGIDFKKQKLFEYSAVPIPANPEALAEVKSKGIDINHLYNWCEYSIDKGIYLSLDRDSLETYHKQLKPLVNTKLSTEKKEKKEELSQKTAEEKGGDRINKDEKTMPDEVKRKLSLKDLREVTKQAETKLVDQILKSLENLGDEVSEENLVRLVTAVQKFVKEKEVETKEEKEIVQKDTQEEGEEKVEKDLEDEMEEKTTLEYLEEHPELLEEWLLHKE